jgi:hypothetical protein
MKRNLKILMAFAMIMLTSTLVFGENFIVKIESTAKSNNLFYPIKPGGSFQFQATVKNNRTDTVTVYLLKDNMGDVASWVTIDSDNMVFSPKQERNFLLTVTVPSDPHDADRISCIRGIYKS